MRKMITLILAGIMVLSLAACVSNKDTEQPTSGADISISQSETEDEEKETVQLANPFKECSSMDEAKAVVGFELVVSTTANGLDRNTILVCEDLKMIQVKFGDDDDAVSVRKEAVDQDGIKDISGVYTSYAENNTVTQNDVSINLKGDQQKVYVATWFADDYNYSIYAKAGMEQTDILALIAQVQ